MKVLYYLKSSAMFLSALRLTIAFRRICFFRTIDNAFYKYFVADTPQSPTSLNLQTIRLSKPSYVCLHSSFI